MSLKTLASMDLPKPIKHKVLSVAFIACRIINSKLIYNINDSEKKINN